MQIEKNISATLNYMMEASRKTKMEFSKDLDIPRSTLQGYLKGDKCLRSDSIEMIAKSLGISPAQLISGPECIDGFGISGLDSILLEIQALHPRARPLAKEAVSLLRDAFRISDELLGFEGREFQAQGAAPENPDGGFKYFPHEMWDPFHMTHSYGISGKARLADGWTTVATVAAFSRDKTAVAGLAKRCTELQLSPAHLLDVVHDFLAKEPLAP